MTRLMLVQLLPSGGLLALVIAWPQLSKPASHAKLFAAEGKGRSEIRGSTAQDQS